MTKAELVADNKELAIEAERLTRENDGLFDHLTSLGNESAVLEARNDALQSALVDQKEKYEQLADQVHTLTLEREASISTAWLRVNIILTLSEKIKELEQDLQHARMQIDAAKERADFWKKQYEGTIVQSSRQDMLRSQYHKGPYSVTSTFKY